MSLQELQNAQCEPWNGSMEHVAEAIVNSVYVITTGGTIEKSFCERNGQLGNVESKIETYLKQIRLPHTNVNVLSLMAKDSLDLTPDDRRLLASTIHEYLPNGCPIVITHGTDTLVETAREIEKSLPELSVPVIFTGAMTPLGFAQSDGVQNLTESLLAAKLLSPGVYLVLHSQVFDIHKVRKDRERGTFVYHDAV
jgi:L-asparaginase